MDKDQFKEKYFILENGDFLGPTDAYICHSERILKNASCADETKDILSKLIAEQAKCFRLLENAIFELLD